MNFLSDARKFHDPDSGSSSGRSHVPNQPLITSSSRRKPSRDSGVPRDTRDDMSIQGNVIEDLPARVHPEEFFETFEKFGIIFENDKKGPDKKLYAERKRVEPRADDDDTNTLLSIGGNVHILVTGVQNHARIRDLFTKWYDELSEISNTRNASWQIPRPHGISKLESKLQN